MTNLFVLQGDGTKRQINTTDFGAKLDRKESRIKGLGMPPPTEMIVIPDHLLTSDQVVAYARVEKRTVRWQVEVLKRTARYLLGRTVDLSLKIADWLGHHIGKALVRIHKKIARFRGRPMTLWSEEETDVVRRGRASSIF